MGHVHNPGLFPVERDAELFENLCRPSQNILIYGATGYTGKLIAKAAVVRGSRPILAGRNLDKVKAVAEPLGLTARALDLGDPAHIDAAIKDISVLLCVAGRPTSGEDAANAVDRWDEEGGAPSPPVRTPGIRFLSTSGRSIGTVAATTRGDREGGIESVVSPRILAQASAADRRPHHDDIAKAALVLGIGVRSRPDPGLFCR